MNSIWGAELNYAPDYWPLWLIYAGVVVVLMIAGLVMHALLRRMLAPKTATGEEHRDYLYSLAVRRWHWGNALLFILLLLSGLFGHFSLCRCGKRVWFTLHDAIQIKARLQQAA